MAKAFIFFFVTAAFMAPLCRLAPLAGASEPESRGAVEGLQQEKVPEKKTKETARIPGRGESVRIGELEYAVPKPWAGQRVRVPEDTVARLQVIPPELTLHGMQISLRQEALPQLVRMAGAARKEGIILQVDSAYRSAAYQSKIYMRMLEQGASFKSIARHTAPPGYSRHALGLTVDFHPSTGRFSTSPAYAWLKKHAAEYGFVETYGKDNAFGILWEPWHWEYQGELKDN